MRRRYESVIFYARAGLQHGCHGHLLGIQVSRTSRRSDSRVRTSSQPAAVGCSSVATGAVRPHRSEGSTIRALMDFALPKSADSGDRSVRKTAGR